MSVEKPTTKDLRSYGLLMTAVLAGIGTYLVFKAGWNPTLTAWILFGVAGVFLIAALVAPQSLRFPYKRWMALAELLNRVMTPVILTVFFFLVITPMGLVMRVFGYDVLRMRQKARSLPSMWIDKQPDERGNRHMENPF